MQAIKAKQECPAKIKNTEYALSRLGSVRAGCLVRLSEPAEDICNWFETYFQ